MTDDVVERAKVARAAAEEALASRNERYRPWDHSWFIIRFVLTLLLVGVTLWVIVSAETGLNNAEHTIASQQSFETARLKVVANDDAFFCAVRAYLTAAASDPRFQTQASDDERAAVRAIQTAPLTCK